MTTDKSLGRSSGALAATPLGRPAARERISVVALGAAVVVVVGGYLLLRSTGDTSALMPFQALGGDLVTADQVMFTTLKTAILELEAVRAQTGRWPAPEAASGLPRLPPSDAGTSSPMYSWQQSGRGTIINYLARPGPGDSSAAWLVVYREPDPNVPTDTAPNDEEHHRLPDGTVLHVSIWMHRFGGQVSTDFVPQPEVAGWTQVLTAPLLRRAPPFGVPRQ